MVAQGRGAPASPPAAPGGRRGAEACSHLCLTTGYETVMLKERLTSGLIESMPDS